MDSATSLTPVPPLLPDEKRPKNAFRVYVYGLRFPGSFLISMPTSGACWISIQFLHDIPGLHELAYTSFLAICILSAFEFGVPRFGWILSAPVRYLLPTLAYLFAQERNARIHEYI